MSIHSSRYDFVPGVLSHDQVDQWVKTDDNEAWAAARRLMRTEGLLVGGSSGSIFAGALRWLKTEEGMASIGGIEGKNVVIVLPDRYVCSFFRLSERAENGYEAYETTCLSLGSASLRKEMRNRNSRSKSPRPYRSRSI